MAGVFISVCFQVYVDLCLARYWSKLEQWWPTGWGTVERVGAKYSLYITVEHTTTSGWYWTKRTSKREHLRVNSKIICCGSLNSCQDILELRIRQRSSEISLTGLATILLTFQIYTI
jgi:hypothetical protein